MHDPSLLWPRLEAPRISPTSDPLRSHKEVLIRTSRCNNAAAIHNAIEDRSGAPRGWAQAARDPSRSFERPLPAALALRLGSAQQFPAAVPKTATAGTKPISSIAEPPVAMPSG